jgi:transcriptional regulator with XRE-family HTH domain
MTSNELTVRLERRRQAIGMTKEQLAARAHVSVATVKRILSGAGQRATFQNIGALADALGMEIALEEPCRPHELCAKQAKRKAGAITRMLQGTMALEAQALRDDELQEMTDQTTHELLAGSRRKLWSA